MVSMGKMGTFGKFSLLQNTYPPHTKVYKRSLSVGTLNFISGENKQWSEV